MSERLAGLAVLVGAIALLAGPGCFFGGPSRVHPPSINASAAGSGAMEQYDTNKDGVVKGEELDKAPSLKAAIKQLDKNNDGGVDAGEVAARVKEWQASKVGKMAVGCVVTFNKAPLVGAKVTFEPEKFLGPNLKPCSGTTDAGGAANITTEDPSSDVPGCPCGLYLVRISKVEGGRELVPEKYNVNTILGKEIALDGAEMQEGAIRIELMP